MKFRHKTGTLCGPAAAFTLAAVLLAGIFAFQAAGKVCAQEPIKTAVAAQAIKWYPYQDSLRVGKEEGKKIFLNFYADWCTYCVKMEKETFRDPEVVAYLNKYFISTRVNSDRQQDLARKYNVQGLPSTWFLAEDGETIGNLPGYIPAKMLLKILGFVGTDSYKTMTFQQYMQKKM
jgi:thioredoxin-related protein